VYPPKGVRSFKIVRSIPLFMVKHLLLEENEAKCIATLILERRLSVTIENRSISLPTSPQLHIVLEHIEEQENTWQHFEQDTSETFGRKNNSEPLRFWSVPKTTASVLSYLALYTNARNILEIGTSAGYSTLHLANAAEYTKGFIHSIENHVIKSKLAKKNFQKSGLEHRIELIPGRAEDILHEWTRPLDFVFLDADKENYGVYLDLFLPFMKAGGLIVADNVNDYGHMMEDYLQKVSGSHFPESQTYPNVQSTWVATLDNGVMVTRVLEENE
jgi:predicted O-methyltransferase YrrM